MALRLDQARAEQVRAEAGISLPDWPADCRRTEPHAPLVAGAEVRSVLDRERGALDRQNARSVRCADHYDTLKGTIGQ